MDTGRLTAPVLGRIAVDTVGILPTDAEQLLCARLEPVLGGWAAYSRVRLTRLTVPGLVRPVVGQIDVQLPHQRVRAQVTASTVSEVAQLIGLRTAAQLRRVPGALAECLQRLTTHRHPSPAPELLPPEARRIVRHKLCSPDTLTIEEAVGQLEAMDYPFHLFRDNATRQDSVVVRISRGRYRVIQTAPDPMRTLLTTARPVELAFAPWRTVAAAIERMNLTGAAFEIFADRDTGRGTAVYARYDGHYAVLRPAMPLWNDDTAQRGRRFVRSTA
jgi:hypothetical protein